MAGHSHWARIKRKKGATDAKRGKVFSMIARNIMSCAREKGGDPDMNPTLRDLLAKARSENMPRDVIERAIKKGTGELAGAIPEAVVYEGYGAGGVAFIVEALTDNRNRTAGELRTAFERHGGNLAQTGSVSWNFDVMGVLTVSASAIDEEALLDLAVGAGAEDLKRISDGTTEAFEVFSPPEHFEAVRAALAARDIAPESAEISRLPKSTVAVGVEDGRAVLKLMELLEENEDVANVVANFEVPEELLAETAS
jgi:YebC/PmpR family DNA-binding regulatory protein